MTVETSPSPASADAWRRTLLTLAAGGGGVALLSWLNAPLPFLLGAVIGAAAGGLGFAADVNSTGRSIGLTCLGLQIGAGFTPEAVDRLAHAPIALSGLVLSTVGAFFGAFAVYRLIARWNRETAMLAAMPGALATVLALMSDAKVDPARVAIAQSIRLGVLVVVFPLVIPSGGVAPISEVWNWGETLVVLAVASLAGWLLERLKTPAGALLGPALISMAATLGGWVEGAPPPVVFLAGLWIIGAATGARLSRGTAAAWRANVAVSLLALTAAMVFAASAAIVIAPLTSLSLPTLFLAFAPGGIEAMVALAAGLGLDPTFVAACHISRVIGITLVLPILYRWINAPRAPP